MGVFNLPLFLVVDFILTLFMAHKKKKKKKPEHMYKYMLFFDINEKLL